MKRWVVGVAAVVAHSAFVIAVAAGAAAREMASERASARPGCVLFVDNFQQRRLDDWFRVVGDWTVEDGKLRGTGWGGGVDAWIYAIPYQRSRPPVRIDVDVEFGQGNAEIVMNSTGHWWNEYRVTFWSMDSPDYPNMYQVARYRHGEITYLNEDNAVAPVPLQEEAHLTVTRQNDTISLYVDGSHVDSITDPEPLPQVGTVGLGVVWDYTAAYDDFVVRAGPCALRKIQS
jgi:hypothetical protein